MDKTIFAGQNFSTIFWNAMRLLFYDENGQPGLIYTGKIGEHSNDVVADNGGKRMHFDFIDQTRLLSIGQYKYSSPYNRLRFEGPDEEDLGRVWGSAPTPGEKVNCNFYEIVETANTGRGIPDFTGFPQNDTGRSMITYFTASIVLHEIMHNHGFKHVRNVDWTLGSDYACSLPHVAAMAVLRASPHWPSLFQAVFRSASISLPPRGFACCHSTYIDSLEASFSQDNWCWCRKCQGLYFAGGTNSGVCSAGGSHEPGRAIYTLSVNRSDNVGQQNWRWCKKCQCLFFAGHNNGICPAGGGHDPSASGNYSLINNVPSSLGQHEWRWCRKCQGLYYSGFNMGNCPAGGSHVKEGSGDYSLIY